MEITRDKDRQDKTELAQLLSTLMQTKAEAGTLGNALLKILEIHDTIPKD